MSSPWSSQLPKLGIGDFAPGQAHVVDIHENGKIIAMVHRNDPLRLILPNLRIANDDPYTYAFIHGGQTHSRFENMDIGTREIPDHVISTLLVNHYGKQLDSMSIRMCTCYGNLLRPGNSRTLVQMLALLLPRTRFEGYHGLVRVIANPPEVRLGLSVQWDTSAMPPGPVVVGPPGNWEVIIP